MKVKAMTNIKYDRGEAVFGDVFEISAEEYPDFKELVEVVGEEPATKAVQEKKEVPAETAEPEQEQPKPKSTRRKAK